MSDRTRSPHHNTPSKEAIDLTELRASNTQSALREEARPSTTTDLTQATIPPTSIARLSAKPEKRARLTPLSTASNIRPPTEREREAAPRSKNTSPQRPGVFRNPHYRYHGGPLGRLLTFFANILKALEASLLATLKPSPPRAQNTPPPRSTPVGTLSEKREGKRSHDKQRELKPGRE